MRRRIAIFLAVLTFAAMVGSATASFATATETPEAGATVCSNTYCQPTESHCSYSSGNVCELDPDCQGWQACR